MVNIVLNEVPNYNDAKCVANNVHTTILNGCYMLVWYSALRA